MMLRLEINGKRIDLYEGEKIGYQKQVNTLGNSSTRQSNFSRSFNVPKTSNNVTAFKGLSILGSTSDLPYIKSECNLWIGNTCLIYRGFAVIESVGEDFKINTYDGNIDFFKSLDNLDFDDIDLSEIEHDKNPANIINSWQQNLPYKYLIADYNGSKTYIANNVLRVNIDYLIPSVKVSYLWQKIFEHLGYSFELTQFNQLGFSDLYLTYPKGINTTDVGVSFYEIDFEDQAVVSIPASFQPVILLDTNRTFTENIVSGSVSNNSFDSNKMHYVFPESGNYRIKIKGSFSNNFARLFLGKSLRNTDPLTILETQLEVILTNSGDIDYNEILYFNSGDDLTVLFTLFFVNVLNIELKFEVERVNDLTISQTEFLSALKSKDFYKEILLRFGLTPIPIKGTKNIKFLTYDEILFSKPDDWSVYFQKVIEERYVITGHEQSNIFEFKYNDEGEDFNNGAINVNNKNLQESKTMVQSKTYSKDRELSIFEVSPGVFKIFPKYKAWNQEVKEDQGTLIVEHKALDGRYYFLREKRFNNVIQIGSQESTSTDSNTYFDGALIFDDSFQDIINENYQPILKTVEQPTVHEVELYMPLHIFDSFNFDRTVHIKQLSGNYIVDSLSRNDITKDFTTATLIRVKK